MDRQGFIKNNIFSDSNDNINSCFQEDGMGVLRPTQSRIKLDWKKGKKYATIKRRTSA